jgi:hypothetical protein
MVPLVAQGEQQLSIQPVPQVLQLETQQLLQRFQPRQARRGIQPRREVQHVLQLLQPVVAQVLQHEPTDAQPQSETGVATQGAHVVVGQHVVGQHEVTQRVTHGLAQQRRRSNCASAESADNASWIPMTAIATTARPTK